MAERIERAKQAFIQRDFDNAINEYTRAIKELPEDQKFVAYSNRGAALMNTGNVKDAIKCFKKALELNGEHYESMHNMGVAFAAVKQFDKALECFEKTLEYAPFFYASHCGKSEALASLNRFEEAVDAAKDGIQEEDKEPIAYADLGFAYLKLGRFEESVRAFDQAYALKDRSSETARLHAIALLEYALVCEKSADVSKAMDLYQKSIQKHQTPVALHNLGVLYCKQKQGNKARSAFVKALKLDANYFPANAALGVFSAKEKRYDLAIQYLGKAAELNPNHIETLYNLGLVYMKEGNYDDALKQIKAVLRIDQSNQDAKIALQLLKALGETTEEPVAVSAVPVASSRSLSVASRSGVSSRSMSRSGSVSGVRRDRTSSSTARRGTSVKKSRYYTLEELKSTVVLPPGVDPTRREQYLRDDEFVELFGMTKGEFQMMRTWQQRQLKEQYKLV